MFSLRKEYQFLSKQGHLVRVRPIGAGDAARLVAIFEHMSSESRYKRYNQTLDEVEAERVWEVARGISEGIGRGQEGLIAFVETAEGAEMAVGAARLVETGPGVAEVAISLRDDFQGLGMGTKLMRLLALEAKERGYGRLTASIRADNPAIWQVFKRLPFTVTREAEGSYAEVLIDLERPLSEDGRAGE